MHHDLYNSLDQKKTSYLPSRVLGLFRPRSIPPSPLQLDNDAAPVVLFHRHSTSQWPDISSVEHLHCQSSDHLLHSTVAIDLHLTVRCDRPLTSFRLSAAFDHWPPSDCPLHSTIYHWPPRFHFQLPDTGHASSGSNCPSFVENTTVVVAWFLLSAASTVFLPFLDSAHHLNLFSFFCSPLSSPFSFLTKNSSAGGPPFVNVHLGAAFFLSGSNPRKSAQSGIFGVFFGKHVRIGHNHENEHAQAVSVTVCLFLRLARNSSVLHVQWSSIHLSLSLFTPSFRTHPLYRTDATTQWHITTDTSKEW